MSKIGAIFDEYEEINALKVFSNNASATGINFGYFLEFNCRKIFLKDEKKVAIHFTLN